MKKIDEIKARRQQRFFERRMEKAKAKKRQDIENELIKHSDLITDPKVKQFIQAKKEVKRAADLAKYLKNKGHGAMSKDVEMLVDEEDSDEEVQKQKVVQKVKAKPKKTKSISKK